MSNDKAASTSHPNPHIERAAATNQSQMSSPKFTYDAAYFEGYGAKQENVAYIWLMFFGVIGAHYFYLGRPGKAISYIFTLGYVGIGPLTDIFRMRGIVERANGKKVNA